MTQGEKYYNDYKKPSNSESNGMLEMTPDEIKEKVAEVANVIETSTQTTTTDEPPF